MSRQTSNAPLRCSQQVRSASLGQFRHPVDGRKWKQAARSRKAFLLHLASYANADGTFVRNETNYSPSLQTLLKDFSHTSYFRLTNDLKEIGWLSWTRERHYDRRVYQIHLRDQHSDSPESVSTVESNQVPDSQRTGARFESNQVPLSQETGSRLDDDSQNQVPDSQKTGTASGHYPSLPSKEREPSLPSSPQAASENHLSLANSEKAKAPRIVKSEDVEIIAAAYCQWMDEKGTKDTGWGKPVNPVDIEKLLQRFSRGEILDALAYTFTGATEKDIAYIEKRFFADGGAVGIIMRQKQTEWLSNLQEYIDAEDLDDLPSTDLDQFAKDNPIPAGLETCGCKLLNDAQKNWKRLKAANYPACEGCSHRGDVLVDGACQACRERSKSYRLSVGAK